ncbi:MAG: MBL fold metallo-hydrolase [Bacteroidetes bacterium]|nr:MBL fold metallo-hydrolase [Bacteroidota bacterium]MBS1923327.1 MBL fold metallo-hydrolase [Bacteroidota bacterium]
MKKILIVLALGLSTASFGQTNGWYTAKSIGEKTWVINEKGVVDDNMYVLEGSDSTLLIDCGFGFGNLRDFVKTISSKPLIVVNTHFHPDHTGGNYQFPKVYISRSDLDLATPFLNPDVRKQLAGMALNGIQIPDSVKYPDTSLANTVLQPVYDKQIFKLGGRDITIIAVPGHSPGSIFLLDNKNKFLFTGDNTQTTWLFFKESLPIATYLKSLEHLDAFNGQFNILFAGHGPATGIGLLSDLKGCCQKILSGNSEAKPYHSFIGQDGVSCTYNTVTIAYDPNKIK